MAARKVPAVFNKEWSGEDGEELKPYQKVFANQLARNMVQVRLHKVSGAMVGFVIGAAAMFVHLWAAAVLLALFLAVLGIVFMKYSELRTVGNKYDKEWEQTIREIAPQPDLGPTVKVAAPMVDLLTPSGATAVTRFGTPPGPQKTS